jgi:hypothetical protein
MIYKISPNPSFPKRGIEKSKKLPTRLCEDPKIKGFLISLAADG